MFFLIEKLYHEILKINLYFAHKFGKTSEYSHSPLEPSPAANQWPYLTGGRSNHWSATVSFNDFKIPEYLQLSIISDICHLSTLRSILEHQPPSMIDDNSSNRKHTVHMIWVRPIIHYVQTGTDTMWTYCLDIYLSILRLRSIALYRLRVNDLMAGLAFGC